MKRASRRYGPSAVARGSALFWGICLCLSLPATAQGAITLDLSSLPSAQGWTYISDGAPEMSIFSVSNGVLTQNTIAGPFSVEGYRRFDEIDPSLPFTISVRARVLGDSGIPPNPYGFNFLAWTGTEEFSIGLSTDLIGIGNTGALLPFDNTQFHDYRLEVVPEAGFEFFVDSVLVATGAGLALAVPNGLYLGDGTRGRGAYAEVMSYTFSQRKLVSIDIKPGSTPNAIALNSRGVIPVAVMTTDDFDATTVDPLSIEFGPEGAKEAHERGHIEDADGDGDLDMVLHFRIQKTGIQCGDIEAGLTGKTIEGQDIAGTDAIQTVGCGAPG